MPTAAQDRIGRGPFAALLILLSLLLGSGTAADSGFDLRQTTRLAPSRHSAAVALLQSGVRNPSDEELSGAGGDSPVPSSGPILVTQRLWARPAAEPSIPDEVALRKPRSALYRARAPPAA